jgi:hypothetical protein
VSDLVKPVLGYNLGEAEYKVARIDYDRAGEEVWIIVASYSDADSAAAAASELHRRDPDHDFVVFLDMDLEAKH